MSKVCRYVTSKPSLKPHWHRRTGSGIGIGIGIDIDIDIDTGIGIDKSKSKSRSQSQKPYVKREITLHFIFKPLWDL